MESLVKTQKKENFYRYPDIDFNAETGNCLITGESFMEDSKIFYSKIEDWLNEFHETNKGEKLTLNIKLSYFNTSSSKMLYELLVLLQEFSNNGQEIEINWYYNSDDFELEEDIIDLCYDIDIEVNQIPEDL